jgi:hypothetical protein
MAYRPPKPTVVRMRRLNMPKPAAIHRIARRAGETTAIWIVRIRKRKLKASSLSDLSRNNRHRIRICAPKYRPGVR